jgi:nucleoside permease NupC
MKQKVSYISRSFFNHRLPKNGMDLISILNGLFGLIVITGLTYIFSNNKKKINWKLAGIGMLLQFAFSFIVLKTDFGQEIFIYCNKFFIWPISIASECAQFVFSGLVKSKGTGNLIGIKLVFNEIVAYLRMSDIISACMLSLKAILIATYALCGFAKFASIANQIGGLSPLVENHRSDIAKLGLKSDIGDTFATWMTASVAGLLSNYFCPFNSRITL